MFPKTNRQEALRKLDELEGCQGEMREAEREVFQRFRDHLEADEYTNLTVGEYKLLSKIHDRFYA